MVTLNYVENIAVYTHVTYYRESFHKQTPKLPFTMRKHNILNKAVHTFVKRS